MKQHFVPGYAASLDRGTKGEASRRRPKDYDRINGFKGYRDPIRAANGEARRATNQHFRLIKKEQRMEAYEDILHAIAAIDAKRKGNA